MRHTSELEQKLGAKSCHNIAVYLMQLPTASMLSLTQMANYITALCEKPENSKLKQWLLDLYISLGKDDILILVKKTGDPGDEVDSPNESLSLLDNESRDICLFIQNWAQEILSKDKQEAQDEPESK